MTNPMTPMRNDGSRDIERAAAALARHLPLSFRPLPPADQDALDAKALFDILEFEVIPLFYDRDQAGIPRGWAQRMKASLKSIGPQFVATRMLGDYAARAASRLREGPVA